MSRSEPLFPRARWPHKGYRRRQVDAFLVQVSATLDADNPSSANVTAADIRKVGFDLVRHGYDIAAVDAKMDELEQLALSLSSPGVVLDSTFRADGETLARQLGGLAGDRFRRVPLLSRGYRPSDVDAFVEQLVQVLDGSAHGLDADDVRHVVFRAKRGGYAEADVDDALDAAVDIFLRRDRAALGVPQAHPQTFA